MKILGIDIGYTNMGLVMALCHGHKIEIEYSTKNIRLEQLTPQIQRLMVQT